MKTIAILDTETTDVDPSKGHLLEVGCVLWSVQHRAVIESRSWLVEHRGIVNAAQAVNGIAPALLVHGYDVLDVGHQVERLTEHVDAFTGWNADFDRAWLAEHFGSTVNLRGPWFDAMDLEWPRSSESRSLIATALAHGVGVVDAHRALTDCLTIARLLERVAEQCDAHDDGGDDFARWLARALRPKVHVEVADKGFDEARNTLVKAHGFRWEPAPVKAWRRKMFREDAAALPFEVVEVTP